MKEKIPKQTEYLSIISINTEDVSGNIKYQFRG